MSEDAVFDRSEGMFNRASETWFGPSLVRRRSEPDAKARYAGSDDQLARALDVELYDLYKRASEMMGPPPWLEREGTQNDE